MTAITAAMCALGRELSEPRLSTDGRLLAYVVAWNGRAAIVVMAAVGGPEEIVTTDPPPRPGRAYGGGTFDWLPDGSGLVYVAVDGDLWRQSITGGPPERLTAQPVGLAASAPTVAPDGSRVAYVVGQRDVAVLALRDGEPPAWPVRLSAAPDFAMDPSWRADSGAVAWQEWDVPHMPWDQSRIVIASVDGGTVRVVLSDPNVQRQQPRFAPVGDALAFLSDQTGWLNVWVGERPLLDEPFEHGDPTWGPGQRSFAWSPDGRRIAVARNENGFGRLCVVDLSSGAVTDVAKGVHGGLSWRGDTLVAVRSGARTPTQIVAYADGTGERRVLARGPAAGFESSGLAEPEAVTWPGDDGEEVHGRLYRASDAASPLIVWVHGGPTSQWPVTFIARVAYFLDRGWSVLLPDHRGSTGHGRAYAQALRERWGELDVADTVAGARAAVANGWGDRRRLVAMGGSAGGFTVLNLLAHQPDLWAAGVALYPVTDLLDLDETTHRYERHYNASLVGPLPAAAARYRERSPITVADRIRGPLLLLHGSADEVVVVSQATAFVDRMRAAGGDVEFHIYEGEGHGWGRPETIQEELGRITDFLRRRVLRLQA